MGLNDFISWLSPRWALKREQYKQAYEITRNYDAGQYDRQNRNWHAVNQSAAATDKHYRDIVRARARDLERNSDLMNAHIHPWIRNVVGKGFSLEAKSDNETFNEEIEALWLKWCKKQNCDVTGRQSFWEMARMAVRRKRIDGGILFIKCKTNQGIIPFQLQAVEVDELDLNQFSPKTKGNRVVDGIEYNQYNRAAGYWIREYDIEGLTALTPRYIAAEDIIAYYSIIRPSQIREMSEMSPVLERVKDVNGFLEAISMKERIAACLSVFIKEIAPTGGFGRGAAASVSKNDPVNYKTLELAPGQVTKLNAGDEIQVVNPGTSATNGTEFIKQMTRIGAAGQGISYEAVSRDLSDANYSSARQATIEDEETFEPEVQKLTDEFLDEVYAEFVKNAVLSNAVIEPRDFWENPDKYIKHEWHRKPKRWIDPLKEANAYKTALETGQKTLIQTYRENGYDYKAVLKEMKELQDYAAEIGLKGEFNKITKGGDVYDE